MGAWVHHLNGHASIGWQICRNVVEYPHAVSNKPLRGVSASLLRVLFAIRSHDSGGATNGIAAATTSSLGHVR